MILKKTNSSIFFIAGFVCFFLNQSYAQLPIVSNQNIDFTTAVSTVKSGNWSDTSVWSTGQIPTANTDVIIDDNHTVYIDIEGNTSGQIIDLCKNLQIKPSAILQMGHNTSNFAKDLRINGSILCNGTFSAGRNQPGETGDGLIYSFNSRVFLNLNDDETYISGSGYFNPRSLSIASSAANRNLTIDLYNMIIDDNFAIKSNNRVTVNITHFAYVRIKKILGITGSQYQFSSPTTKANLNISGIVVANDVSLFTINPTNGEESSITIEQQGSLSVQKINNGVLDVKTETAGFHFTINTGGLFRLGAGVDFENLTTSNPNFSFTNNGELRKHYLETLPNKSAITSTINQYNPEDGTDISKVNDVFGASHIAGWYNFTDKPFLLEGLDRYKDFGSTAIKTTLSAINGKMESAYPFNHTWQNFQTIKEVAQHEFIDSLFKRAHIKTHTFWTTTKNKGDYKKGPDFDHQSYINEELQFYNLTKHLLQTYGSLDKKFVYQNWEGDWMLRGQGVKWEDDPNLIPDDIDWIIEGMARMFRARQRGTERARNEFSNISAKVYHGIEFNKLWMLSNGNYITMMDNNTPSVIANVVPLTRIDVSSWSAYDGGWRNNDNPHGHAMYKGLKIARYFTTESGDLPGGFPVQIGEFGINENPPYNFSNSRSVIRNRYNKYIAVALALDIPNFYLWNLYCSGQQGAPDGFTWEKDMQYETDFLYEWMDGKWIIEPDGTWGHAANYLMELTQNTFLPENGIWNSSANWSKGNVPNVTDRVMIPKNKTVTIHSTIPSLSALTNDGTINLNPNYALKTSSNFVNSGVINLFSDNNNSAVLFVQGSSFGKVTYSRGGLTANKWSLIMPPISGQPIKEFAINSNNDIRVNSDTPKKYAIAYYDDSQISGNKWQYFDETISETLTFSPNKSYALSRATDGSVTFKGTVSTNDFFNSVNQGQWNAIGNPFTTYYPANKNNGNSFLTENYLLLDEHNPAIYVWSSQQEKYTAVTELDSETRSLAPGQGFFVKLKEGQNLLPFRKAKRIVKPISGNYQFNKKENANIQLKLAHKDIVVKMEVKFFEEATSGFDAGLDIGNFAAQHLDIFSYLVNDNQKTYTIQSISSWKKIEIPLGINARNKEISIKAVRNNIPQHIDIFLEDRHKNIFTDLSDESNAYTITISDDDVTDKGRFYLHIDSSNTLSTTIYDQDNIQIYISDNKIKVKGISQKAEILMYDILGKVLLQQEIMPNQYMNLPNYMINGVRLVKIKTAHKTITQKVVF